MNDFVAGLKTYFILGKKSDRPPSYCGSFKAIDQPQNSSLQVMISPPTSPPSMSPQARPRVLSCDTTSAYMKPLHNPNQLSPDVCKIKASSLPSILDSDNEQDASEKISCDEGDSVKTPTSTASSGRYSVKLKNWKMPKFLRKNDQTKANDEGNLQSVTNCDDAVINPSGYQQVPTIIETQQTTIALEPSNGKHLDNSWSNMSTIGDDKPNIYLDDPKDTIDVKSYISQSRSDIGPYDFSSNEICNFLRVGSYRSQYGRSANEFPYLVRAGSNRSRRGKSPNMDMMPTERARSATVHTISGLERHKNSLEVPRLSTVEDRISTAQSVNSRKDSGIKSNSRRSSIQQVCIFFHIF